MRSLLHAVLCLLIFGCGSVVGQQAASTSSAKAVSGVVLTDRDNGTDVDLAPNTLLMVKLPSTPSTGYVWTIAGDPAPLKLQKSSFQKGKTKSGTVGASGTAVFQLNAS